MDANDSVWSVTATKTKHAPLERDVTVDVAIVGGGITGLTAAVLLARAGQRVVLLEARRLGGGVSDRSTTHMTEMVDTGYAAIESDFGKEGARLVASSSRASIDLITSLVDAHGIRCAPIRRPGYQYTERAVQEEKLRKEHEAARRAGLDVQLLGAAPLPFATRASLRFPDQLQVHIGRYLAGLATAAVGHGAMIHEGSRVIAIEDGDPCALHIENGPVVTAKKVFCATHAPLNRVFLQTKVAAYRSYVLAFRDVAFPDGLFWDMDDPYHYLSAYPIDGASYLLVGGEDHKTGKETTTGVHFDRLAEWTRARVPVKDAVFRWSAQVEEPVDGLPFIGRNSMSQNVYVATGFSGNGTTFGTIAAMIVESLVTGKESPWASLYAATRVKPLASATAYASENVDFPIHLVTDHLKPPEAASLADIAPGEGKTVRVRGERLAVYRDPKGALHAVSSVCTHLGCTVRFNQAETTWDCPCHGSRFGTDGMVLDGPATRALRTREIPSTRHASGVFGADDQAPVESERAARNEAE
jgi:glycine/D-amino acid oxidase-like deaminating enzyme/nitrite reductase/ring-hydroxylating ferredoxin subunit